MEKEKYKPELAERLKGQIIGHLKQAFSITEEEIIPLQANYLTFSDDQLNELWEEVAKIGEETSPSWKRFSSFQIRLLMGSKHSAEAVREIEKRFLAGYGEGFIGVIKQLAGNGGFLADNYLSYLSITEDRMLMERVFTCKQHVITVLERPQLDVLRLWQAHPNREAFIEKVKMTPRWLGKLIARENDSLILFLTDRLDVAELVDWQVASPGWGERLTNYTRLCELLEIGETEESLLTEVLWQRYAAQLEPDKRAELEATWAACSFGEKMELGRRLKKSLTFEEKQRLSRQIEQRLQRKSWEGYRELIDRRDISWLENHHHPLAHLYARTGYEIEFVAPVGARKEIYKVIPLLGIKAGDGGMANGIKALETAPGPFRRAETAEMLFLIWARSGLLGELGTSVHFNLEVKPWVGLFDLLKGLQATGYAFAPRRSQGGIGPGYYANRVKVNENGFGLYIEYKDFNLESVSGFLNQMRLGSLLGSALRSYQRVSKLDGSGNWEEEKLAKIWEDYQAKLQKGFDQLGYKDFFCEINSIASVRMFVDEINAVLKRSSGARHESVDKVEGRETVIEERRYPNLVAFAREIAWESAAKVAAVMEEAEAEVKLKVTQYVQAEGEEKGQIEKDLFSRFPCGLGSHPSPEARGKVMKLLVAHYSNPQG